VIAFDKRPFIVLKPPLLALLNTSAAILREPRGRVTVTSIPLAEPGTGEVLVKMEACGLCHSDLFVSSLEKLPLLPLTLGHEGIARIEALGAGVTGWEIGDRAGITFLASTCGACDLCLTGRERFCSRQLNFGYTVNGALTGYAVVPAPFLVRVPEALAAEEAAPLCCAGWEGWAILPSNMRGISDCARPRRMSPKVSWRWRARSARRSQCLRITPGARYKNNGAARMPPS